MFINIRIKIFLLQGYTLPFPNTMVVSCSCLLVAHNLKAHLFCMNHSKFDTYHQGGYSVEIVPSDNMSTNIVSTLAHMHIF